MPKLLLALVAAALAAGVAFAIHRAVRGSGGARQVVDDPAADDAAPWQGNPEFAADPVAGFRRRKASTVRHPMTGLDLSDPQPEIVKRRDAHAFLRERELPRVLDRPTVLVVGDSHVDGVVSTPDNVTSLLEAASERTAAPYYCLNAGCGLYSLWQHVLRARDLLPAWRPRVVVVVVFLGNDLLDLDNPKFPHLDDTLRELPGRFDIAGETTSARLRELALPYESAFWQGLNQALVLHREPARLAVWMRKAAHAITAMEHAAKAHDARVVWVLLPSVDLVFPDLVGGLSPLAREVTAGGAQRRARDAFAALLAEHDARVVDAEPAFRADGTPGLYAYDYHVYRRGHRLLAELLAPVVAGLVAR
jgi:hypothetical protein